MRRIRVAYVNELADHRAAFESILRQVSGVPHTATEGGIRQPNTGGVACAIMIKSHSSVVYNIMGEY